MLDHDKIHPGNPLPQKDDHLSCGRFEQVLREGPVSYTHLTLPTIYSV